MIIIGNNVRIRRIDSLNLLVEFYEEGESKKTKEKVFYWNRRGYYANIESALNRVLEYKLHTTVEQKMQIKDIITQIEKAKEEIKNLKVVDPELEPKTKK